MRLFVLVCFLYFFAGVFSQDGCVLIEYINGTTCSSCPSPSQNKCTGCNGLVPPPGDSPLVFDFCGTCNGLGNTCMGCDGVMGSGKNYDECGICDGNNACQNSFTEEIVFTPEDSGKSNKIYQLPLAISMRSNTPGANVYYRFEVITEDAPPLTPPNLFSLTGSEIITSQNITIKAIALAPGKRISVVKSATFLVSVTGSKEGASTTLIPGWAIAVIVICGSLLVLLVLGIIFYIRIRNRRKMVAINLDANERAAKEDTYRAIYDYKANNHDEMDLKVGDIVFVTQKHADGWWEGRSYRLKGKEGSFPGNYVEVVPADRLMWVERPKTVMGRFSQRVSNFFGGAPEYGTDPEISQPSKFTQRVSRIMGIQTNNTPMLPPKPTAAPPRPTGALPPKPSGLPPKPTGHY